MENASKALLMAGGILIAIIIIALLVRSFNTISMFQKAKLSEEEQAQLVAFNEQYTKYLNQYVYGTEVITVINNVLNNPNYDITVNLIFLKEKQYEFKTNSEIFNYTIPKKTYSIKNSIGIEDIHIRRFVTGNTDLNNMAFKCTSVSFDSYGRINSITFEGKEWGDLH